MSKTDFTAAIEARLPLRAMEDEIDAAIAGSAKLTIAMIEARKAAGLPIRDGHALIYKNMEIGMALADARAQAVKLHAGCAAFGRRLDLPTLFGDQWDCGMLASAKPGPNLSLVADRRRASGGA